MTAAPLPNGGYWHGGAPRLRPGDVIIPQSRLAPEDMPDPLPPLGAQLGLFEDVTA